MTPPEHLTTKDVLDRLVRAQAMIAPGAEGYSLDRVDAFLAMSLGGLWASLEQAIMLARQLLDPAQTPPHRDTSEAAEDAFLAAQCDPIVNRIKPALAGKPSALQGLVCAELLAIWLAGHNVGDDEDATRTLRAHLLAEHCTHVRELTEVNAIALGTPSGWRSKR